MQASRREKMPWYLHKHVQTANRGLLMTLYLYIYNVGFNTRPVVMLASSDEGHRSFSVGLVALYIAP